MIDIQTEQQFRLPRCIDTQTPPTSFPSQACILLAPFASVTLQFLGILVMGSRLSHSGGNVCLCIDTGWNRRAGLFLSHLHLVSIRMPLCLGPEPPDLSVNGRENSSVLCFTPPSCEKGLAASSFFIFISGLQPGRVPRPNGSVCKRK